MASDLRRRIEELPFANISAVTNKYEELDSPGLALWNLSIRLQQDESLVVDKEIVCLGKIDAY